MVYHLGDLSFFQKDCIFISVDSDNPPDSVFEPGRQFNYLLEVVALCELDNPQIATVALQGTGPVAINVEHRLP
jgi:hypothetical protein